MESQFSTPSKDCIQEDVTSTPDKKTKTKPQERQTPDISHLVYV